MKKSLQSALTDYRETMLVGAVFRASTHSDRMLMEKYSRTGGVTGDDDWRNKRMLLASNRLSRQARIVAEIVQREAFNERDVTREEYISSLGDVFRDIIILLDAKAISFDEMINHPHPREAIARKRDRL